MQTTLSMPVKKNISFHRKLLGRDKSCTRGGGGGGRCSVVLLNDVCVCALAMKSNTHTLRSRKALWAKKLPQKKKSTATVMLFGLAVQYCTVTITITSSNHRASTLWPKRTGQAGRQAGGQAGPISKRGKKKVP